MTRITEQDSLYQDLEKMTVEQLTAAINREDKKVAVAVEKALPQINALIREIVNKLRLGGRMFYLGAGSGGRLAVLDAIELPTTYGIEKGRVVPVLAGGVERLADALEEKEDEPLEGWMQLTKAGISAKDIVIGISASGTTPFVLGALEICQENGITTGCIVSNPASSIATHSNFPVEIITGPEFVTGSTRMKCGTAQKMVFDMISTTVMISLGRVEGNKMVHVKLINDKIVDRSVRMLMEKTGISDYETARSILIANGSVKNAAQHVATMLKN
jgi:N-acetylmuramic acid 6-phosphate etherase